MKEREGLEDSAGTRAGQVKLQPVRFVVLQELVTEGKLKPPEPRDTELAGDCIQPLPLQLRRPWVRLPCLHGECPSATSGRLEEFLTVIFYGYSDRLVTIQPVPAS